MIETLSIRNKEELNKLFLVVAENLDITETQFNNLKRSYNAVGKHLEEDPTFLNYHPVVTPQGSLRLGTIIQPITEDGDIDVDLVYRLESKHPNWTQKDIKQMVGQRLKDHGTYCKMLDKEGRRCWTLLYRQNSDDAKERYHMDILPCVVDPMFNANMEIYRTKSFSSVKLDDIAIRITDNQEPNYNSSTYISNWSKSNPDGYAIWFAERCKNNTEKRECITEDIMPIGKYVKNKTVLQRIVQILKRHRDIMFKDDEDKPISIIITTLAAKAYKGEDSLLEGLVSVISSMEKHLTNDQYGNYVVSNPANPEENFADKWPKHPKRKENFFRWLKQLKYDVSSIIHATGLQMRANVGRSFGDRFSQKLFNMLTEQHKNSALSGDIKVAATGALSSIGKTLNAKNTFFGKK